MTKRPQLTRYQRLRARGVCACCGRRRPDFRPAEYDRGSVRYAFCRPCRRRMNARGARKRAERRSRGVLLWEHLDPDRRMTPEKLLEFQGADDPQWLAKRQEVLRMPRCRGAVPLSRWDMHMPCMTTPRPGQTLCTYHGGDPDAPTMVEMRRRARAEERRCQQAQIQEEWRYVMAGWQRSGEGFENVLCRMAPGGTDGMTRRSDTEAHRRATVAGKLLAVLTRNGLTIEQARARSDCELLILKGCGKQCLAALRADDAGRARKRERA